MLDVSAGPADPVCVALADGAAESVTWTADGDALLVTGTEGRPAGHARLLSVPVKGGAVTDLAGSLDRNVMAGGPGYPGARPQQSADGTVLFCVRDRGCTHVYAVSPGASRGRY